MAIRSTILHVGLHALGVVVSTVLASLLPTGATAVLYAMTDMTQRLVLIGVFQVIFAVGVGVFTNGRVVEIFASTAAYVKFHRKFCIFLRLINFVANLSRLQFRSYTSRVCWKYKLVASPPEATRMPDMKPGSHSRVFH